SSGDAIPEGAAISAAERSASPRTSDALCSGAAWYWRADTTTPRPTTAAAASASQPPPRRPLRLPAREVRPARADERFGGGGETESLSPSLDATSVGIARAGAAAA